MPIVPRVNPAPLPGVRLSSSGASESAFGGGMGIASAGLNTGLSAVHGEAARIAQEEKLRADQIMLTDAGAQASGAMNDVLFGPDGALTKKGSDAFTTPETTRANYFAKIGAIRAGLTNDDQRDAFDRIVANDYARIDEQVQRHVAQQRTAYDTDSTDALVANKQNEALQSYTDPAAIQSAIDAQKGAIAGYADRNGWSDDQRQQAIAKQVSATHFGVLSRMIDAEQDIAAGQYFDAHKGELVGNQLVQAQKLVDAGSVRAMSQRWADQITSGKIPGQLTPGNIDLSNRPRVVTPEGGVATVRSISIARDGKEILIPTVSDDGNLLTDEEAIAQYDKTGKQLGIFENAKAADAYALQLHNAQAAMIAGKGNGVPPTAAVTLTTALQQAALIDDPRVRDATEQRIRRAFADRASDERQQREDAFNRASAILEQTKDATQIPLALRMKMTPEENIALDHREDQLRHPRQQTDLTIYTHLINMSALNDATRAAFLETDLSQYRGQLSDADYKHLLGLQRTMRIGEDRTDDSAVRRLRQREEADVIKASDAATKQDTGIQALRDRLKAQGKSQADIDKILPAPQAPRIVVPQWMVDSAAHDTEYADYLRRHGVPIAQPAAGMSPSSTSSTTPTQQPAAPSVPGAPLPRRSSSFGPGDFGLSPIKSRP
jgi:hypothetical protein